MDDSENPVKPLVFHTEKCNDFRIIYAEGVFGGIAPRGALRMTFFNEGLPVPEVMTFEVSRQQEGTVKVVKELPSERIAKKGIIRHLESEIVMPINSARKLHSWFHGWGNRFQNSTPSVRRSRRNGVDLTTASFSEESVAYSDLETQIVSDDYQLRFTIPALFWSTSDDADESAREEFRSLCDLWRRETRIGGLVSVRYLHPAYQRILAMGPRVVPWVLDELKIRPDRWFAALGVLSKDNPVPANATFSEAVEAWLNWGRIRGYDV